MISASRRCCLMIFWNLILFVLAVVGAVMNISNNPAGESFVYYTQDSNIFLGIASGIYCVAAIGAYRRRDYQIPFWVQVLKYLSVCCIAVTFIVVLCILLPMCIPVGLAKWILIEDSKLFQHILSPVIALAGFLLIEHKPELPFKMTFIALIPTCIYAAVIYPLNILRMVDGPYPFLQVYDLGPVMSVVWFFIILAVSYLLAFLVWLGNRKISLNRT